MRPRPEYSFVFVCQKGDLEIKAMLLAASLQRFVSCSFEMVAAVPQPESRYGALDGATTKMLQDLGTRFAAITNEVDPTYPIANKISAMAIGTSGRRRIFLDTDIIATRTLAVEPQLDVAFGAVPAAQLTWGRDTADWDRAYALYGLTTPPVRVRTVRTNEEMAPYYNAGFILAREDVADDLARMWLDCARTIDREPAIDDKRPWLDQIALPIAITRLGLPHHFLDESFNCPPDPRQLASDSPPYFCHYHNLVALKRVPALNRLVRELADEYPALRERFLSHKVWRDVLSDRFGLLDTLRGLRSLRRRLAPPGTRRSEAVSMLAKRVRSLVGSRGDFRG